MADDMYDDLDWGDDPFSGDMDFDTDFDGSAKHGFLRSFATGFLSGIVEKTVGDTDARVDTLKMVLPRSWTSAFTIAGDLNRRRHQIVEDLKKESAHSIEDLQYLAKRAGEKLQKITPNKIGDGLIQFSQNDFSHWEGIRGSGDTGPRLEGVEDREVKDLINTEDANSLLEREATVEVGKSLSTMMTEVGGRTIGGINTLNMSMGRTNHLLEQVVDFQRRVQLRNDALKVNLLSRIYLTNAKYYKFMEAAQHRSIAELKAIAVNSAKSDYEKTTHSQAARKAIRDSVFNTVRSQFGGIAEWVTERMGKDARGEAVGTVGEVAGAMRMALEMTEGGNFNFGQILGNAAAGMFVSNLPRIVRSNKGQEYVAKFKKQFPEMAKWAEDAYKRIEDLGHVASYSLGNAEGMANTLAEFYQGGFDHDDHLDYDDYLDRLKPGQKALDKLEWEVASRLRKLVNKGAASVLEDTYQSTGSRYSVQRRSLADGFDVQPWNKRSDRTLNETIPALLEGMWHSLEKIRTGDDNVQALSYDYIRGHAINSAQKEADTFNRVFNSQSFKSQADSSLRVADMLGGQNLSPAARRTLAMQLTQHADKRKGFSPYLYMNLDTKGVDPKIADEIRAHFQREFDITPEAWQQFKEGSEADRIKALNYLPSEAAREKAAKVVQDANLLGRFIPDISENLDTLRGSGYYDALKKAGIMKNVNGYDEVDTDLFWKTLQQYIDDPEKKQVRENPAAHIFQPTRGNPFRRSGANAPAPQPPVLGPQPNIPPVPANASTWPFNPPAPQVVQVENKESKEAYEGLNKTLVDVKTTLQGISDQVSKMVMPNFGELSFDPLLAGITTDGDKTREKLQSLIDYAALRNDTLTKILERQPMEVNPTTATEANELKQTKRSIIDRIKNTPFKEMFNRGVEKLLDHEPLILGGLLGGLVTYAIHNPKGAALVAGGVAAATIYGKVRSMAFARHAKDTMDLYEEGAEVPILEAFKLRRGDYYDMLSKRVIDSWEGITGSIRDLSNNTVIQAKRLAGKLFTEDNKEVFLKGLNKMRELAVRAFKWFDPMERLKKMWSKTTSRFYQMDVYIEGQENPVLLGSRFAKGQYFAKDGSGNLVPINGWNEIEGAVYDADGNTLITEDEYEKGLYTSMGASINKLGAGGRRLKKWGMDILGLVKDKARPYAKNAWDKTRGAVTADYTPIVSAVDRIYYLLLDKWGYKHGAVPVPEGGPFAPPAPDLMSKVLADGPEKTEEEKAQEEELVRRRKARKAPAEVAKNAAPEKETPYTGKSEEEHLKDGKPKEKTLLRKAVDHVSERHPHVGKVAGVFEEKMEELRAREAAEKAKEKPAPKHEAAIDDKERLNSIANRKEKAKQAKDEQVKDSIIKIAESVTFGDGKGDEKKPRKGLLGLLGTLLGGIGTGVMKVASFFTNAFVFSGFRNLFRFGELALRILPAMGTGIAAIAKGIMTLVQTRSLGQAAGSVWDTVRGDEIGPDGEPRKRKKREKPTRGKRFTSGAAKVGAGMAISYGANAAMDMGVIDPDSGMGQTIDMLGTAASIYGGVQMATSAAGAMGIGTGFMTAAGGMLATAGTAIAGVLFSPITLGILAAGAVGYGIYKAATWNKGKQTEIRMTQYGLSDTGSDLADKILQAEGMLKDHVVIANGRASLSKSAPIEQVLQLFMTDPTNQKELGSVFSWFNGRFKPVFMTYMACLDVVKMKSLKEYDESANQDTYKVAKQAHTALSSLVPFPYSITVKIDPDNPPLDAKMTVIRVNNLLKDLKKYVDGKDAVTDMKNLEAIPTTVGRSEESLQKEKQSIEAKLADKDTVWGPNDNKYLASHRLKEINKEINRLNATYKAGTIVGDIYIDDLMPDGKALDLLTAIRVACYGNEEDITWRVQAVLKLERHCESMFIADGEGLKFNGDIGELFTRFKDAFQVSDRQADDWCLWFRDRFLPVLTNYMVLMKKYRKGRPGAVWKTLSVTARYEIAKGLTETQVEVGAGLITSIWNVRSSPFKGSSSPRKFDKVDRMVRLLGEAAITAKLRDPEAEAGKTNSKTWAETISPHKPGGGMTDKYANIQTPDQYKNRMDTAAGGQYGTMGGSAGTAYGTNGVYKTPDSQYGYKPLTGDSDTSHLDMTGVEQQKDDGGVTVPRKLAEQLVIREMLKQGFTDPRAIAEMLALTNYETGGYSKTTENMKYSSPEQLVKLFKEVKSMEQARQLVQAGEVAIANTVYGGGKGASLGNTEPGDGYRFRGRGFVQLTGRANYRKTGQELGIDLENHPELASDNPNVMAAIAVNFFKNSKLLQSITQNGDFGRAATGLNGGNALPGMDKRYSLYLSYLKQLENGQLKADDSALTSDVGEQTGSDLYGGGKSMSGGGGTPSTMPSGGPGMSSNPSGGMSSGGEMGGGGRYTTPQTSNSYGGSSSGWSGGADAGGGLVDSNAAMGSGLRLKSEEAVAGGSHHPGLQKLMEVIQSRVPGFRYFSAVNDAYHKNKGSKGAHPKGLACDFTLTNGIQGSDQATSICVGILRSAGLAPSEFLVINEYRKKTAIGTGGHVHAAFRTPGAAEKFLQAYGGNEAPNGQDTTPEGGGLVQPKAEPTVAMPAPTPGEQRNMPPMDNQNFDPAQPMSEKGDPEDTGLPQAAHEPTVPERQMTQLPLPNKPNPKHELPEGYLKNKERFGKRETESEDDGMLSGALAALKDVMGGVGKTGEDQTAILAQIHRELVALNQKQADQAKDGSVRMN